MGWKILGFLGGGLERSQGEAGTDQGGQVPGGLSQDAFRGYLQGGDISNSNSPISLGHDILCVLSWVRQHFLRSQEHSIEAPETQMILAALILAALAQDATQLEEALMKVVKNAVCGNKWERVARISQDAESQTPAFQGKADSCVQGYSNVEQTG